jgi:pyridoxamine 5'-phosphate oxidase
VDTELAARLRREYEAAGLLEASMAPDPFQEFRTWFAGVTEAGLEEPNAFVLATSDADGNPSARAVLMKEFTDQGLVFYTGMASRKSNELSSNPNAAATFVWVPLHRQVRFEGTVTRVPDPEADVYFATRPRGAQIAAHASKQSEVVPSREYLEERFSQLDEEYPDEVPRPPSWGGWRLIPRTVEFWQGRPNRFHDRILYEALGERWSKVRLAP